jgi:predicted ATPase/class 3 adenylate cyclase
MKTESSAVVGSSTSSFASSPLLTFLIADVRGYTRYTLDHGDEAAARLADRFAALCEEVLGAHEGRVIELRGDEALTVFSSARHALRGAVALQQALKDAVRDDPSLPLTVGMGLDAGEPIPVRGGYRGGALNLAARLCSIAGPGEILASETVIGLARKTEGLAFIDRGQVQLKGLSSPVRVLQIAPEGELPEELPPLQPILVTHPTNLPDDPTPFIGREAEIAAIAARLRDPHVRMVTLTGPGGTGKTRLALQVGNTLLYDFSDGVFFCDLAPLADPSLVPSAIAEVLGVNEEAGKDLTETLIASLKEKHLLLVLDNFEHLLDACQVVADLLDGCRDLHVLVTSRIPLHLSREQEHAVPPLSIPDPGQVTDAAGLSQYESVALFIQRAKSAKDSFSVTDTNAPAVAEICARLDGLPLAIELAAARIKLFPPQALLQRLDSRLKLLTGGAKDRPSRQQTLRGAIDWSYSLLSQDEQTLFARLSVFAGDCSFDAAEAVCNQDGELDLLDGMASLVDKSLIRQDGEDEEPRFSMLETIREYAAEKLAKSGEEEHLREAHAGFYVQLAQEAEPEIQGPNQLVWFRRLDSDVPNLWVAVRNLFETKDVRQALILLSALYDYWIVRVHYKEAMRWLDEGLRLCGEELPAGERGKALWALASTTSWYWWGTPVQHRKVIPYAEQALPLLQEAGDRLVYARALNLRGNAAFLDAEYAEATEWYEAALEVSRQIEYHRGAGIALSNLANIAEGEGDDDRAKRSGNEALDVLRSVGDCNIIASQLYALGLLNVAGGELEEGQSRLNESLAMFRELGRPHWIGLSLVGLGALALKQTAHDTAQERLGEALGIFQEIKSDYAVDTLAHVAALSLAMCAPERAGRLLGAMLALREKLGISIPSPLRRDDEPTIRAARDALGEEAWQRARVEGASMTLEEATAFAIESCGQARRILHTSGCLSGPVIS